MLVFIYGTLKRGCFNHDLIKKEDFICEVETSYKYPMYQLGQPFPYLQNTPGMGEFIQGELYEINSASMPQLDFFEGVPDLYHREKILVKKIGGEKTEYAAHTYFTSSVLDLPELGRLDMIRMWNDG